MKHLVMLLVAAVLVGGLLLSISAAPVAAQEGEPTPPAVEEPLPEVGPGEPIVEGEGEAAADIEDLQPIAFALRLTGLGMGVVFVALVVLSGLLSIAQRAYKPSEEPAAGAAAAPQQQAAPSQPTSSSIAPEVMAAISAAVAIATQKRFRIKRIRYREAPPLGVWSRQGRITIMTSRKGKSQK